MAATIKIKNSSTAGAAPTSSDLVQGELAVNVTDKRLFTENASGTIVELGTNPSVPVTFPDGSASAPSLTNDGDTNTGLFFPAADTVGIATGGTERLRLDTSGNMGLGVTPSSWDSTYKALQVGSRSMFYGIGSEANMANNAYYNAGYKYVASSAAGLYTIDANVHKWYNAASGTAGNAISFTQAMTLDANGKLLVGGTTSDLSSTSQAMIMGSGGLAVQYTGTTGTLLQVVPGAANGTVDFKADARSGNYPAMTFYTFATERARITSSGELLVGTTSASITSGLGTKIGNDSAGAFVSTVTSSTTNGASFAYTYYSTGAGAYRFYVGAGGTVFATSTTISSLSDARYKENIRDLDAGLSEIMALQPRKFDWKEGKGANIKNARGFIAQEFEQVFPDMIDEWRDEAPEGEAPYKSVRADLIPVLVKAIQEQQAIIETLTSRIEALEQA